MPRRSRLNADIISISELANAAEIIETVRRGGRPLVITKSGLAAAVVLSVKDYERMVAKIDLFSDIRIATQQVNSGQGIPNHEAKAELRRRFPR
jgi:prevent-host-death family protein